MNLQQLQALPKNTGHPLRVAFRTLGCRLNQYDTESIKTRIAGFYALEVVDWNLPAEVYVLNSCTVTVRADQEARRLARQVKRRHPHSKVVVVGCYAQTQPEALSAIPEIDGVIGNTAKDDVASWLPDLLGSDLPTRRVEDFTSDPVFDAAVIDSFPGRSRAVVKIQDGCNLRCTYCLIWRARGPGRSRSPENVLAQLRQLAAGGCAETVLAGIHLGGYGRDRQNGPLLPQLLAQCLREFPELRLRLSSIHPNEVTGELLGLYREHANLRRHLHVSLQSGSDTVLKRMKRPYRSSRVREAVLATAAVSPHFGIGADIIVGFPGETEAEFEQTRQLLEDLPLSYLHVFRFSQRPGTAAAVMPDQVDPREIARRSDIIRRLGSDLQTAFSRGLVGTTREAIVEGPVETGAGDSPLRLTTTDNYVPVRIPDQGLPGGSLVTVKLAEFREDGLYGEVVSILQPGPPSGTGE